MMKKQGMRWAFNAKTWHPNRAELLLASSCIQNDEKERISKFIFKDDAKSSLIGRLMMRKYVHIATMKPYEDIKFDRDERGKPTLCENISKVSFNISHQGDFVVLAGENDYDVGVDVMKIEAPINKNITEFFRIMNRQFSSQEWAFVKSFATEREQISAFYRLWCLKESYVKNIGVGVTVALGDISFKINTRFLKVFELCSDTVLFIKGVKLNNWVFEETLLDEKHAVAVAAKVDLSDWKPTEYKFLLFDNLMQEAKPFNETDEKFAENFLKKENKN